MKNLIQNEIIMLDMTLKELYLIAETRQQKIFEAVQAGNIFNTVDKGKGYMQDLTEIVNKILEIEQEKEELLKSLK